MKKIFVLLLCFKESILFTWIFFFILSLVGKTPYTTLELLLITGGFTIFIFTIAATIISLFQKFDKNK